MEKGLKARFYSPWISLFCLPIFTLLVFWGNGAIAEEPSIRLNGYLTAGVAISDEDSANFFGITDDATFDADSIVAIQADAEINEQVSATVQLVARGEDDYAVEAEWAFLQYKASPNIRLRAGRMRLPVYMLSDYIEVGYAYPWVRPPFVVYGLVPIYTFNGVDLYYRQSFGEWSIAVQPFYGASKKEVSIQRVDTDVSLSNIMGATFTLSNSWASFHLGHARFDADLEMPAFGLKEEDRVGTLSSAGADIKWNNWMLMAEYSMRYTDSQFVADINSWYTLAGYRYENFLPYVSFSVGRNNNSKDTQTEQDTLAVGVRWDVMENIALKLEGEAIDIKNGSIGGISYPENMTLWTVTVDTVF